jgi:hypothetical protein
VPVTACAPRGAHVSISRRSSLPQARQCRQRRDSGGEKKKKQRSVSREGNSFDKETLENKLRKPPLFKKRGAKPLFARAVGVGISPGRDEQIFFWPLFVHKNRTISFLPACAGPLAREQG